MSDVPPDTTDAARAPSRREWLKSVGAAGAAVALPFGAVAVGGDAASAQGAATAAARTSVLPPREPLQALSASEADTLDAIVARLIPSDATGPGAVEAGAVRYIDRALAGGLKDQRDDYAAGLGALDRYCRATKGAAFAALSAVDQDAVLAALESGTATAPGVSFEGGSAAFFSMVRSHALQGTFGDPYYGGNANFIGWDLIGYPGVRTVVTAEMTRLGAVVEPHHRSAYDSDAFVKATALKGGHAGHGGHDGH